MTDKRTAGLGFAFAAALCAFAASGGEALADKAKTLNCFDPRLAEKLPATCKRELVTASGSEAVFFPRGSARSAWQKEVRIKYGDRFLDFDKAACGSVRCSPGVVGTLGKIVRRCEASGYPCSEPLPYLTYDVPPSAADYGRPLHTAEIRKLQRLLRDTDDYDGRIDGLWGPQTLAAVQKWQRRHKISPVIGDDAEPTRALLEQISKSS